MRGFWISLILVIGCNGGSDDGNTNTDDTGTELECRDGADDDGDGDIDCDDADCADDWVCNLPDALNHETITTFTGRTIECKLVGVPFDYDVPDCVTDFTADLTVDLADTSCEPCDRVYKGPLTWGNDSCSELLGEDGPKPESTEYGLAFRSETDWMLYVNDPAAGWVEAVPLENIDGRWVNVTEFEVREDIEECANGEQYLGDLRVEILFDVVE